jgi:hypothetical protein
MNTLKRVSGEVGRSVVEGARGENEDRGCGTFLLNGTQFRREKERKMKEAKNINRSNVVQIASYGCSRLYVAFTATPSHSRVPRPPLREGEALLPLSLPTQLTQEKKGQAGSCYLELLAPSRAREVRRKKSY